MSLSAILLAIIAPILIALSPVLTIKDAVIKECADRAAARHAVKPKIVKRGCPERRYMLM